MICLSRALIGTRETRRETHHWETALVRIHQRIVHCPARPVSWHPLPARRHLQHCLWGISLPPQVLPSRTLSIHRTQPQRMGDWTDVSSPHPAVHKSTSRE